MFKLFSKKANPQDKSTTNDPVGAQSAVETAHLPRGTETILLAEDEEPVRENMAAILRDLGYVVHAAADGQEAVEFVEQNPHVQIDLLLTDIVMPRVGGKELVYRLGDAVPKSRILFCSAYPGKLAARNDMYDQEIAFLQKPFTAESLSHRVRDVLDVAIDAPAEDSEGELAEDLPTPIVEDRDQDSPAHTR